MPLPTTSLTARPTICQRETARSNPGWTVSAASGTGYIAMRLPMTPAQALMALAVVTRRLPQSQIVALECPDIGGLRNLLVRRHVRMTGRTRGPQQDRVVAGLGTLHGRCELELMHGHDAVVIPRSRDQRRRVASAIADIVQWRVGVEPFEGFRAAGGAVLGRPERTAGEILVAKHVEHAVPDVGRAEERRILCERGACEQAAVGVSLDPQVAGRGVAMGDQGLRGPGEIIEHILLVPEHAGLMPFLTVRAAASQIG